MKQDTKDWLIVHGLLTLVLLTPFLVMLLIMVLRMNGIL